MKALILNGAGALRDLAEAVDGQLHGVLAARGDDPSTPGRAALRAAAGVTDPLGQSC